jgi:hypothetical protein
MIKVTLDALPHNGLVFETMPITAAVSADGEDLRSVSYQWLAGGQVVATTATNQFTPLDAQVGKAITVNLLYSDPAGTAHQVAGANSVTVLDVENRPTGGLDVVPAETEPGLWRIFNVLDDADGMGTVSYQWKVDGKPVAGATRTEFRTTPEQVDKHVEVVASWIDGRGHAESVGSDDLLFMWPSTWGTAGVIGNIAPGQTLHATVTDPEGLNKVYYAWDTSTDGKTWTPIPGATSADLSLGAAVPELLRASITYADNRGNIEDHHLVYGGAADDTVESGAGDRMWLGAGNDTLVYGRPSGVVDGGAGLDTFVFGGFMFVSHAPGTDTINVSNFTAYGVQLVDFERVILGDKGTAFDTDGAAGQAYRLYQAAFDRKPDDFGIGFWISQLDKGISLLDVANAFVDSAEFKDKYAKATTNAALVDQFYANILHRAPDPTGQAFWTGVLDKHQTTVADVLVHFSESPENVAALVGTIENGISYLPYTGH